MNNEQKYKTPSKQETIADIVAEMRSNEFDDPSFNVYSLVAARTLARGWADRIEAAVNQPVTNCNRLGNAAKMREALVKADAAFSRISQSAWFVDANFSETKEVMDAGNAITSALSSPPRNCDVGTADEQHARFYSFCDKIEECKECPLWRGGGLTSKCCAHWGQMPYEGADAK